MTKSADPDVGFFMIWKHDSVFYQNAYLVTAVVYGLYPPSGIQIQPT